MCWHREDNAPPSYSWTLTTTPVAGTTVRCHNPPGALGLVILFDGGGGGSVWFTLVENRLLVEALVDAGYAVAALPSAGPTGDYDMTANPAVNQDLQNVDGTIAALGFAGGDVYYVGFSSGGAFASLATVFTPARAITLLNVRGLASTYTIPALPPPPTLWVVGRHDLRVPPTDAALIANWAAIALPAAGGRLLPGAPLRSRTAALTVVLRGCPAPWLTYGDQRPAAAGSPSAAPRQPVVVSVPASPAAGCCSEGPGPSARPAPSCPPAPSPPSRPRPTAPPAPGRPPRCTRRPRKPRGRARR